MKASETTLKSIIEGKNQYVVPLFQRTYSWERKQWEPLWDDLIDLCETSQPSEHFFGSIVTAPAQSVPQGVTQYLLIDGQQRLTTIFLLLALMRDEAKKIESHVLLSKEIEEDYLFNRFKTGLDMFKLLPTQGDRESFTKVMHGESDLIDGQIALACKFFRRKLRSSNAPDLQRLTEAIIGHLALVSITLSRDDNPYLIFESLNAKGQSLSQSDLIRNYFVMRIHINEQERIYQEFWQPMQDKLGKNLTEFIRHFLMKDGAVVKQNEVYFALKLRADAFRETHEIVGYLQQLSRYADFYEKLLHPEQEPTPSLRERLHRLNQIEVTVAYPFLLNLYSDYEANAISTEVFAGALDILENFLIRRFVCSVPTFGLNKIFPYLYGQAKQESNLLEGIKINLRSKSYPRDNDFKERLASSRLYGHGDRLPKTRLILERLEASFGHKETVSTDPLTIEHIMPRTLTDWWKAHLGAEWQATYEILLDTLGNLTLTGYNSELSNANFPRKKEMLKQSNLQLNKDFSVVEQWKQDEIQQRADALSERALSIWPSFSIEQVESANQLGVVTGTKPTNLYILGQEFSVNSWREVAQFTLETIADLEEEAFTQVVTELPHYVALNGDGFRKPRQLKNGAFMETNLQAQQLHRLSMQIVEFAGLSPNDWRVDYS